MPKQNKVEVAYTSHGIQYYSETTVQSKPWNHWIKATLYIFKKKIKMLFSFF